MAMITTRRMSEAEIEAKVERFCNHLDRLYLAGSMTLQEYNANMESIGQWADATRRASKPEHQS